VVEVPGFEVAVRYVPSVEGAAAGGDWYDVVPLAGGKIGIGIGDVMGRGVAAAAVMGRLRYATRAYAVEGESPELVLARLNHLVLRTRDAELATMTYAVMDPANGELTVSSAGHPMPLIVRENGAAEFATCPIAPPIGVAGGAAFSRERLTLAPGDTIVFYTDGLIEERGEDLDVGMRRLQESIPASCKSALEIAESIAQALLPDSGPTDDAAYLVIRRMPAGVPASPSQVSIVH
jgi:serine phosphatase RsbU (regulator of sigma subunit)